MNRIVSVVFALGIFVAQVTLFALPSKADTCTPALCASLSPKCWNAYEKIMLKKSDFKGVRHCQDMSQDREASSDFLRIREISPELGRCACGAAFWQLP